MGLFSGITSGIGSLGTAITGGGDLGLGALLGIGDNVGIGGDSLVSLLGESITNPGSFSDKATDWLGLSNVAEQEAAYGNAKDTLQSILGFDAQVRSDVGQAMQQNKDNTLELLGGADAVTNYTDAVNNWDSSKYQTDTSKLANYQYGKNIDDFMDPAAQYNIDKSVSAAQNAMAGQGGLSGGAAATQLQAVASQAASSEYDKAYDRMDADKKFDYGTVKDWLDAESKNGQMALTADAKNINNLSNVYEKYLETESTANDNILNNVLASLESNSNLRQALAQLDVDKASQGTYLGNMLSGEGGGILSLVMSLI